MGAIERYRRCFPGHRIHLFGPSTIRDEFRRLFCEFSPDVDIIQSDDTVKVRIELPDVKKEDMEISLRNNLLIIKGEKRSDLEKKDHQQYHMERKFGSFTRTLELPALVKPEGIISIYRDGVLEVILNKFEEEESGEIKIDLD